MEVDELHCEKVVSQMDVDSGIENMEVEERDSCTRYRVSLFIPG